MACARRRFFSDRTQAAALTLPLFTRSALQSSGTWDSFFFLFVLISIGNQSKRCGSGDAALEFKTFIYYCSTGKLFQNIKTIDILICFHCVYKLTSAKVARGSVVSMENTLLNKLSCFFYRMSSKFKYSDKNVYE